MSRREWKWSIEKSWVRGLTLVAAEEVVPAIREVVITRGNSPINLSAKELRFSEPGPSQNLGELSGVFYGKRISVCDLELPGCIAATIVPGMSGVWNYPGDFALLRRVLAEFFRHPATSFVTLWLALALAMAHLPLKLRGLGEVFDLETESEIQPPVSEVTRSWAMGGFGFLIAAALFLELREPRYFLHDDNFAIFYPILSHGCEIAFCGHFPQWTSRQFLGMPMAELGTFALTYPPTYLAYFVARDVLGDPIWSIDIFCWGHLFLGYWATFALLRWEKISAPISMWAAICWCVSGYALIASRSWYYMSGVFVYVPLIALQLRRLENFRAKAANSFQKAWKWILSTGVLGGLFYHAGNAQMWLYAWQLLGIAVVIRGVQQRWSSHQWLLLGSSVLIALGVAAPLLVPQWLVVSQIPRPPGPHEGIFDGLMCLLLPYPLAQAPSPCDWASSAVRHHGQFYFAGGVFTLFWLAEVAWLTTQRPKPTRISGSFWTLIAFLALLLSLGNVGGLWYLQSHIPVLGRAYHPFKYLPFFHLAALIVGAKLADRVLRCVPAERWASQNRRRPQHGFLQIVLFFGLALVGWHIYLADTSFYRYSDRQYPPLPTDAQAIVKNGEAPVRIMPICPIRSPAEKFVWGLGLDFATVYGLESLDGYSEFVRQREEYRRVTERVLSEPFQTLQKYGVKYLVVHRTAAFPIRSPSWDARWAETQSLFDDLRIREWCRMNPPVYFDTHIAIFRLPRPDPPAFWESESSAPLTGLFPGSASEKPEIENAPLSHPPEPTPRPPVSALLMGKTGSIITVDCHSHPEGGRLVLNYLWRKGFFAQADNKPLQVDRDEWGRIVVRVPAGAKIVRVWYQSPWHLGIILGNIAFILGISAPGFGWKFFHI